MRFLKSGIVVLLVGGLGGPLAAEEFQLVISGECPGVEVITVAGAEPGGALELYRDTRRGSGVVPDGDCAGTPLGLASPKFVASATADASGRFALVIPPPMDVCEMLLQPVQLTGCEAGNAARLDSGPAVAVPWTGQTATYRAGDDGELRPGAAWPVPRFTDNGDGTATDHLTGLIWLTRADCIAAVEWSTAVAGALTIADGTCGLTDGSAPGDWRLPSSNELWSLIDFSQEQPALPASHPFTGVANDQYWCSSSGFSSAQALTVSFSNGRQTDQQKTLARRGWPVRGGSVGGGV